MSYVRAFVSRVRALVLRSHAEREMNDEFRAHIDSLTESNIRRGMSAEAAHAAGHRR